MDIIAHRGYSGKYPENSALAFEKALALPIEGVECDVRLTRDGKVVVNHDARIDRTSNASGKLSRMDWDEVRQADIGGGQRMLLLDELLEMVRGTGKHLYIELKHLLFHDGGVLEEQVKLRLRYAGMLDDPHIHVISFHHTAIRKMERIAPQIDRYYLRRDWERMVNKADVMLSNPTGLGMSVLRAKLQTSAIGSRNRPTYLWTVDDEDDVKWAFVNGVDVLATNQPEVALRAVNF